MKACPILAFSCFFFLFSCGAGQVPTGDSGSSSESDAPCSSSALNQLTAIFDCSGKKIDDSKVNSSDIAWLKLEKEKNSHLQWNGVGSYGGCTATLLNTGGGSGAPAYIITAGHCFSSVLADPTKVFFDRSDFATKTIEFDYFVKQVQNKQTYSVTDATVRFASMAYTDVAIVELNTTFGKLTSLGYNSYELSNDPPKENQEVTLVSIPLDGIASSEKGLRKADCKIGKQVRVQEDIYDFQHSVRHHCSMMKGSSGSSVIDKQTKKIIAINNTAVTGGVSTGKPCDIDYPCEVASDGSKSLQTGENYAQPTYFLSGCFKNGLWNQSLSTCQATIYTTAAAIFLEDL